MIRMHLPGPRNEQHFNGFCSHKDQLFSCQLPLVRLCCAGCKCAAFGGLSLGIPKSRSPGRNTNRLDRNSCTYKRHTNGPNTCGAYFKTDHGSAPPLLAPVVKRVDGTNVRAKLSECRCTVEGSVKGTVILRKHARKFVRVSWASQKGAKSLVAVASRSTTRAPYVGLYQTATGATKAAR